MDENSTGIGIMKKIDAYLKGNLPEDEVEKLWVELLANQEYLEYLETEIAVRSILHSDNPRETPATFWSRPLRWIAAAVLGAIVIVSFYFLQGTPSPELLALGSISLTESLESPEVMRSQAGGLTGADSLLNIGFHAAQSGDLDEALSIYESVIRDFPADSVQAQAYLNIGIIRYNRQDFDSAASAFELSITANANNAFLNEKAYWFLGNTYLRLGQLEEARSVLNRTLSIDGHYSTPADRLLQRLD